MESLNYNIILKISKYNPQLLFVNKKFFAIFIKYAKGNPLIDYQVNPTNGNLRRICEINQYIELDFKLYKPIILKNLKWKYGLKGANLGGHLELTKLMISKGAKYFKCYKPALIGNHYHIIDYLIKIESEMLNGMTGLLTEMFIVSCGIGNLELVKYFLDKGIQTFVWGLKAALENNHLEIFNLIAPYCCMTALIIGCRHGYITPELLNNSDNYNDALIAAMENNHIDVAKTLIDLGANLNCGLVGACRSGNIDNVNWMIYLGATDWNSGLECAKTNEIANLMISKGATTDDSDDW